MQEETVDAKIIIGERKEKEKHTTTINVNAKNQTAIALLPFFSPSGTTIPTCITREQR